jgi:hypothetical protein
LIHHTLAIKSNSTASWTKEHTKFLILVNKQVMNSTAARSSGSCNLLNTVLSANRAGCTGKRKQQLAISGPRRENSNISGKQNEPQTLFLALSPKCFVNLGKLCLLSGCQFLHL